MGVAEIVKKHMTALIADLEGSDKAEESGETDMEGMDEACPTCDKPMKMSKMEMMKKKANEIEE